eukprot:maker-scaffold222_size251774-snap-gene-0.18 protein:Tk11431 transcript:maker-scaffold222_size251774-snap-gene-0.18-mRNA-1 annotation:"exonuclease 3 -5 domain-containing protein 2-like isoform x2"
MSPLVPGSSSATQLLWGSLALLTGVAATWWLRTRQRRRTYLSMKARLWGQLERQLYLSATPNASADRVGHACRVTLVQTADEWEAVSPEVWSHVTAHPLLGLDCEWLSARQKGQGASRVALLQLGLSHGHCVLVRLHRLERVPDSLSALLAAPECLKLGVGVLNDAQKLKRDYGVVVQGAVDLRGPARELRPQLRRLGLAGLAQAFLGVTMDKDWRISASNWEADVLSPRQVTYAANDALVAVNVALVMLLEGLEGSGQDVSGLPDLCRPDQIDAAFQLFRDCPWRDGAPQGPQPERSPPPQPDMPTRLARAKDPAQKMSTRKTPLYHNARLLAPDGQPLCVCDTKKAAWYVKKGLATQISEEPFTVQLLFEPSGRPEGEAGEYYLTTKENVCVVCGDSHSYVRKYIVPHEYRKHFPEIMRDHQSHDILLMCVQCHQKSNLFDFGLRHQLATECNAPIGTEEDIKVREDFDLKKVRSAARALEKHNQDGKQLIPPHRVVELEKIMQDYYQVTDVNQAVLARGSNLEATILNSNYCPHGKKVVDHFVETCGLIPLEKRWRHHFLNTMKPKYLPPLWSVDHQQERLDIKATEKRINMDDYRTATLGWAKVE